MGISSNSGPHGSLDPGQYTSLALTHVQYHPGDPLSMPLSLITLAPPFLLVSYGTLILVRRELTLIIGLFGQLGCEGLNLALKRIFKQGRPTDFLGTGYGMPSSHSQFMGYFMAFWCLHLYRFRPGQSRARRAKTNQQPLLLTFIGLLRTLEHTAMVAFVIIISIATAYSRYHLSYHTSQQILIGFSVGFITGSLWYYLAEVLLRRPILGMKVSFREILLDHSLLIAFRLRDSWTVWDDGGIEGEYGFWRYEWNRMRAEERHPPSMPSSRSDIHLTHMLQALRFASQCEETTTAFSVGCVITIAATGRTVATGYSRQTPGNTHAEEVALNALSIQAPLKGSAILALDLYTTMEPCSERLSRKSPCVQRILDFNAARHSNGHQTLQITRIFQGVKEPDDFVQCVGSQTLLKAGLQVIAVSGPCKLRNVKTGEDVQVAEGWIGREALRLAKKGHPDQQQGQEIETRLWKESDWVSDEEGAVYSSSYPSARTSSFQKRR